MRRGPAPGERTWLAVCLVALLVLAQLTALRSAVLVSTLGVVVVVAGLVLRPALVAAVAAVATALAAVLVVVGAVPDSAWLRFGNVVVGSALGLSASVSRSWRVRQIRRLQRRDAALLGALPVAVVGLDAAGSVSFANPAARALLGPAADGVTPLPDLPAGGAGENRALALGDGRVVRVDWRAEPLDDEDDVPSTLVVLRDAAPRLAALAQAAQLAEARRETAVARHYLGVLEEALRPPPPTVPGVELGISYTSFEKGAPTGGDLHDALVLPDGSLYLLVLDALGHGVAATRDALRLVHAARVLVMQGVGIGELAARVDAATDGAERVIASLVAARLDPRTGETEVAAAGHPPALVVRGDGRCAWLESPGRVVGVPGAGTTRTATERLGEGDTLVLYTDGLVEADRDLDAGLDRLPDVVRVLRSRPVDVLASRTADLMLEGTSRRDDCLVLAARRVRP